MKYYLGLDIGGTTVKGVCVDADGELLSEGSVATRGEEGASDLVSNAAALCKKLVSDAGIAEVAGLGIGCPGMIDGENGSVVFAGNLGLKDFPIVARFERALGIPVAVTNDANAAALGEARFGAGKRFAHSLFVTLGTGVGGGVIIDKKLFTGNQSAGAEIGHMVIERYGNRCTCGRRGCFEAYSSATALIKKTKEAMEENAGSAMWSVCTSETATGKTAFDFADCDDAAREVVEWYVRYLACGLVNLANIFRPQAILLGGGVSAQGERLTVPLQEILDKEIFGGNLHAPVKILTASLGNRAGALGAAALAMTETSEQTRN